ncbi:MAG: inositol monophosphatase family protein [Euryarchaeota archaeon]|nr:inositol monophosphatase family protein [Euryarchaeota archaeon]
MEFKKIAYDIGAMVERRIAPIVNTEEGRKTVKMGADGTPTKYIDLVAEREIINYIDEKNLRCTLISEEIGKYKRGDEFTIIADPIDGTTNACSGIPFFSVSLAFYRKKAEFAFVRNLATGDTFMADENAYLNGKKIKTRESEIISLYSFSNVMPLLKISKKIRNFGSQALELCFVACGGSKAFIDTRRRGRFFDIAAGKYILERAGGILTDAEGEDIPPEAEGFSFAASCSREVQTKIINIMKKRDDNENRNGLANR